ncbi:sensor histidine kinase [Enhygromyxa salina]|uniref:histidine kinase n=1 Tax=Enhygromyxa salina TaxID=215803 RepID=A0A0C2CXX3_9BACT|nr:ATP-binding protein [Enhygromyxa salina]KIG15846.1 sensor histidine kinase [Enhygromyxa salina]
MSSPITQPRSEGGRDGLPAVGVLGVGDGAGPRASLGQLAAEVGHEISRPLQIIAFAVDDLRDALFNDDRETAERCIDAIEGQIQRSAGFAGRLLAFDNPEARALQPADLNEVVGYALAELHNPLAAAGICVQTELSEGLGSINCCPSELVQAIINVVLNAADAVDGRAQARIAVRTFAQQDQVCVEILDNGPGIAAEHLTRIFDPFFTTKPRGQDTGLGLSITRGITRRHGGSLEASSKIGEGACVRLSLPSSRSISDVALAH